MYLERIKSENKVLFNLYNQPILLEIDESTHQVLKHSYILGKENQVGLYTQLFLYDEKILLIPMHASEFCVFDCITNESRSIKIPHKELAKESFGYFVRAIKRGHYVYAFGVNYPGIVKVNLETEIAECVVNLETYVDKNSKFLDDSCIFGNNVVLPLTGKQYIGFFNIENETFEMMTLDNGLNDSIQTCCCDEKSIWLITGKNEVYIYDINDKSIKKNEAVSYDLRDRPQIAHACYYKGNVFAFPSYGTSYYRFLCKESSGSWENVSGYESENCFFYVSSNEEDLAYFCEDTNLRYTYNVETQQFNLDKDQLNSECLMNILLDKKGTRFVMENKSMPFCAFVDYVKQETENA